MEKVGLSRRNEGSKVKGEKIDDHFAIFLPLLYLIIVQKNNYLCVCFSLAS